ncbi:conserved hypothetical protein [Lodderomyces elongisporus NRRL YB-4239]|uniref:Thioredoxin domain-containing protein n=1 Tax=Lodderomyces elongisporus (strain ATCC 11503 / CBS 2605 / JCM 1781 / NBRC 1676 / NRRL YB-4239) TaxID=379508 RepID=A5E364_LODEL|nr:conserved hypothetical protein [Lodderomyces elongisporus NRRL YB-4239]
MLIHLQTILLILQLLLRVTARAQGDEYRNDPNIIELSSHNFDKLVHGTNYTTIVKFYAPWCGYCQQLKPIWKKLGKYITRDSQLGINVASLNCDNPENKPLCSTYQIQGFPTLMVFRPPKFDKTAGKSSSASTEAKKRKRHASEVYNGQRTLKAISTFLTSRLKNYVTKLHNLDKDLQTWIEQNKDVPRMLLIAKANLISPLLKTLAIDYLGLVEFAMIGKYNEDEKTINIEGREVVVPITDKSSLFYYDAEAGKLIKYQETEKLNDKLEIEKWVSKVTGVEPIEGSLSTKGKKIDKARGSSKSITNGRNGKSSKKGEKEKNGRNENREKSGKNGSGAKKESNVEHDEL